MRTGRLGLSQTEHRFEVALIIRDTVHDTNRRRSRLLAGLLRVGVGA
jgi:hypothetical protein